MFRRHPLLSLVTLGYLAIVGWVTLGPQPVDDSRGSWLWRLLRFFSGHELTDWLTYSRVEFLANVAMFLPIGVFFVLLFGRRLWFVGILAGAALTLLIEGAQLFLPGRVPDVRDLIANFLGATIGVFVALVLTASKAGQLRRRAQDPLRTRSRA